MEVETSVVVLIEMVTLPVVIEQTLAVDDAGFGPFFAFNGNGLAFEIDIPIPVARVSAGGHEDCITGAGGINRRLNGFVICRNATGFA